MEATKELSQPTELALKQSTTQRQTILRAAFAGQLVPQEPNDEPASVLLERIRAGPQNAHVQGRRKTAVVPHAKEETC